MNKIWAAPVLMLFMISAWFHYQTQLQIRELQQRNFAVNQQLVAVSERLAQVSTELVKFEANSLDGMVRDANDALLSGWESLVNTVGEELKKARQPIPKPPSQKPPVLESPDGTDRI